MAAHLNRDDAALWAAAASDPQAFGTLYERHARAVFAFCARQGGDLALAEDLTSIVFLEAWRKRRSITIGERGALPWLLGTAHNVMRNRRRTTWRYRAALRRVAASTALASSGIEDDAIAHVDAQRRLSTALRAVNGLPKEQQAALNLVVWSGLSYQDAADALGIPIGTVRSRVARARAALGETDSTPSSTTMKERLYD